MKTAYIDRLGDAIQLLCNGVRPADQMLAAWITYDSEALQEFAIEHGPKWAQGIALVEAAEVMASQPIEGDEDHETAPEPTNKVAVEHRLRKIVGASARLGYVVTVSQSPRKPLAMGNADTVIEVREANYRD